MAAAAEMRASLVVMVDTAAALAEAAATCRQMGRTKQALGLAAAATHLPQVAEAAVGAKRASLSHGRSFP